MAVLAINNIRAIRVIVAHLAGSSQVRILPSVIGGPAGAWASLDHLVGGDEQVGWYIKAKCLGGLEVDSRLEPCRSLNW